MFFNHKQQPQEDLANLRITDARVGDTLSVSGAAPDFSDVDFTVDRADQYEAGSQRWIELSGPWRETRAALEVHYEAITRVMGNFDGRRITLDEVGLNEDDLAEIDARQNQADFFDWDGKFWMYRSSREIGVFGGASMGKGFYGWLFQEQGGKRFISIRKHQGEPFYGMIWQTVEPTDITVYRGK